MDFKSTIDKDCSLTNRFRMASSLVKFSSKTASIWDLSPSAETVLIVVSSFPDIISWSIKILIILISYSLLILSIIIF